MAKLVRKTPSLKSQGAKYSTTSRSGVTSYYGSSKDVDAGKAPISKVGGSSGSDKVMSDSQALLDKAKGMTLSTIPANMTSETPANIPTPPTTPNYGDVTGATNQGMVSIMGQGTAYDPAKGFTTAPTQATDNFQSLFEQAQALGNQAFQDMGTDEERMRKLERENQLRQKENAVNEYTAQLNSIVAKQQQDLLRVEGQGRGIPDVIIGGQQAQINKEAAIASLPVQAQLAAAQGALDMAQSHIDKMFQIQSNDALAKYNYTSKLIDSVYNFATGAEQRRLDAIKAKEDRAYEDKKTNLAYQRDLAAQATQSGQSSLAGSLMRLDPNSPTYSEDLAKLGGQVVDTTSALQRESLRANIAQSNASTAMSQYELQAAREKEQQMKDAIASGQVILEPEQQDMAMKLGKQFEDESKGFKTQVDAYNRITASSKNPSAAGDLSLIFGYMKMLDPGSVVRETEFANAQNAAGIPERIRAQYNNALRGERLTQATRNDFVSRATEIYNSSLEQQLDLEDMYRQQGTQVYGLPSQAVDLVVRDIRSQGALGETTFGMMMNQLDDNQLLDLQRSGLLYSTATGI